MAQLAFDHHGFRSSKAAFDPSHGRKSSSQSRVEQATVGSQALNLNGLGRLPPRRQHVEPGNYAEWEQEAGKVRKVLYLSNYY